MPPKTKGFSSDTELRMIHEIERRPVLWDVTSALYKRADLKPLAWEEVAEALGSLFTADVIAKRFKNMKETFMKNLQRVRASKNKSSGNGADDNFKPVWPLYVHLTFLEKTCAQADSESNLPPPSSVTEKEFSSESIPSVYYDDTLERFMVLPLDEFNGQPIETQDNHIELQATSCASSGSQAMVPPGPCSDPGTRQITAVMTPTSSVMQPPRPTSAPPTSSTGKRVTEDEHFFNKRGSSKKSSAEFLEGAVRVMEKIANQPTTPAVQVDATDTFCSFISSRLRSMTEANRKECENEIMKTLMKY